MSGSVSFLTGDTQTSAQTLRGQHQGEQRKHTNPLREMSDDGPSLRGKWASDSGPDVALGTRGLFHRGAGMLSASLEGFEPAPGCHQEHQGRARRSQETIPKWSSVSPNALRIPLSPSCELSGFCLEVWECWGGSGLSPLWSCVSLGTVTSLSEPQTPLYQ